MKTGEDLWIEEIHAASGSLSHMKIGGLRDKAGKLTKIKISMPKKEEEEE